MATVAGILISILTALIEADEAVGRLLGMVAGSVGALGTYLLYKAGVLNFGSDLAEAFWARSSPTSWTPWSRWQSRW
jgi:hypothetical protein